MMEGRKYRMTRVGDGDYLCLSNDGQWVWRFNRYEDGSYFGLVCDFERRTFWHALSVPKTWFDSRLDDEDLLHREEWWYHHTMSGCKTRKAAIDYMLEVSERQAGE